MGVPLAVIPSRNHFEQQCNATDLARSKLGKVGAVIDGNLLRQIQEADPGPFREWVEACGDLLRKELEEYYPPHKPV
jgi:hypothetical protein